MGTHPPLTSTRPGYEPSVNSLFNLSFTVLPALPVQRDGETSAWPVPGL